MKLEYIDFGYEKKFNERPHRGYTYDAGMDVQLMQDIDLQPHTTTKVPLGFGLDIPPEYAGYIAPRSSFAIKGITPLMAMIDSTYNGEINAMLCNPTDNVFHIDEGTRVCSLVVIPVMNFDWVSKDEITRRNKAAFGSTGTKGDPTQYKSGKEN